MTPLWWSEADQAELDAGIWELVVVLDEHRPSCETCIAGFPPCAFVGKAIEALIDWRYRRALVSKAEWLRRRHLYARLEEIAAARRAA